MNTGVCEHIDLPVEEIFEVLAEPDEIEERPSCFHLYDGDGDQTDACERPHDRLERPHQRADF